MSLIEAIRSATAEDLDAIDAEIVELERQLAALREARKVVDLAVNGRPERGTRRPREAADPADSATERLPDSDRGAIRDLLAEAGPLGTEEIGVRLRISRAKAAALTRNHPWFRRLEDGRIKNA